MFQYLLHAVLQLMDGILTYVGVVKFGSLEAEGNPLVRYLMAKMGLLESLIFAKTVAFIFLLFLWKLEVGQKRLKFGLVLLNFIYAASAVVWICAISS